MRELGERDMAYGGSALEDATAELAGFYERVAVLVGKPMPGQVLLPVAVPAFAGLNGSGRPRAASAGEGVAGLGGGAEGTPPVRGLTTPPPPPPLWGAEDPPHPRS